MPTLMGYDSDHAALARRGRARGRRDRLARRHGDALRRDPARRGLDVDDDQRPGRDAARVLRRASARSRASPLDRLRGTVQTDILKEYIAQKEWIFPPEPSMRLVIDMIEWCSRARCRSGTRSRSPATTSARPARRPRRSWRSRSPTASRTSRRASSAGSTSTRSRRGFSFFFNAHIDFFEEIAKYRAARRIWARQMRETFGAQDPRSWLMRFHTQTAGRLADGAAAGGEHRSGRRSRRWPRCSAGRSRCTRTPSTRRSRCRPRTRCGSRCAPSR